MAQSLLAHAVSFVTDATAGTIGGVVGVLIGSPWDVVKTRVQLGSYASPWHCAKVTLQTEGLMGFFRGALVASLGQAPNNFLVFGVYGSALRLLHHRARNGNSSNEPALTDVYLAGSCAGVVQSVALAPFEHIKVQQQVFALEAAQSAAGGERVGHLSLAQCARRITGAHGTRALMRGFIATAVRDLPSYGLYFLSAEWVKRVYLEAKHSARLHAASNELRLLEGSSATVDVVPDHVLPAMPHSEEPVPVWVSLLGGSLAGVMSWSVALPADVIKSNIQGSALDTPPNQLRFLTVARRLLRDHGPRVFFRGALPCIVRSIPVNAVTFLVYDRCLWFFKRKLSQWSSS